MELRHLRYFLTVADELHFTRAAERLGIAQPPLSQQIRQLEMELGTPLFDRANRRVTLTEAGKVLAVEARQLLQRAERLPHLAQQAARGERGWLGLGFVGGAIYGKLPAALRAYRHQYPDVELELFDMDPLDQLAALRDGRIHLAFVRAVEAAIRAQPTLTFETAQREPLIAAMPSGHALARGHRDPLPLSAMADEPFLLYGRGGENTFSESIRNACAAAGFTPRVVQHTNDLHTMLGLVAADLGVAIVPASARTVRREGVVFRDLAEPTPTTELLVVRRVEDASPALANFLTFVRRVMNAHE